MHSTRQSRHATAQQESLEKKLATQKPDQALLNELKPDKNYDKIGVNHLGFVVKNVQEIANNLLKNGYKRDYPKQEEQFRIRDYFADADGNQYEFVQYLSDKPEEKNSYNN